MRSAESRVKVVGPAVVISAALALLFAAGRPARGHALDLCPSPVAGPLAGLGDASSWGRAGAVGWAAACGLAIAAHPVRAGWLTGLGAAAGVTLRVLFGVVLTYDGV